MNGNLQSGINLNSLSVLDECQKQIKKDREELPILRKVISSTSDKLGEEIKDSKRFCLRFLAGFLAFCVFASIGFRFILWN